MSFSLSLLFLLRKIKIILSSSEQERGDKTRVVLLSRVVGIVVVVVSVGVGVEREREREKER